MENVIMIAGKYGEDNNNLLHFLDKSIELTEDAIVLPGLIRKVKSEHLMVINGRIPRQIISFDEQYLRCCLEMIKMSALRTTPCNVPLDVSTVFGRLSSRKISRGNACDWDGNVYECPGVGGTNRFIVSSAEDTVLGAITKSKSMINILKSPLLCQMGALDSNVNFERTNLVDVGKMVNPNSVTSHVGSDSTSSEKVQKEALVLRDHIYGYDSANARLSSLSSTNSSCSDHSSSSALVSQGMLHCTWYNGLPHYVFSIDDHRGIYIAKLLKAETSDEKVLDFMYIFHTRSVGKNDVIIDKESDLVGKMKVTTLFTLLPDNTEVKETQFVLFGIDDECSKEMRTPCPTLKRSLFSRNLFKASRTNKFKNSCKYFGVSSSKLEYSSLKSCQGSTSNLDPTSRISLSEDHFSPNLELAAIVLKTQISHHNSKTDLGGWGFKFLKKRGNVQTDASAEKRVPSQNCLHENGDCSTSIDIIIPAGFHGGPRTRNGGPYGLTKRWKSGGHCDCGGWDEGCPLTVLNARSIKTDVLLQTNVHLESKTFDFLVEGSKQDVPTMKMVNVHDNLYCISFESTLSALQSFSIATAIVHAHSPTIQPSSYEVKLQDSGI